MNFELASLYRCDNNDGADRECSVSIAIAYSTDGGKNWLPFNDMYANGDTRITNEVINLSSIAGLEGENGSAKKITLTACKKKEIRKFVSKTFSYDECINCTNNIIQFLIFRVDAKSTDTRIVNSIYLSSIVTTPFDKEVSLKRGSIKMQEPISLDKENITTRLAVKIKATDDLSQDTKQNKLYSAVKM